MQNFKKSSLLMLVCRCVFLANQNLSVVQDYTQEFYRVR